MKRLTPWRLARSASCMVARQETSQVSFGLAENLKMKAGVGMSPGGTTVGVGAATQW